MTAQQENKMLKQFIMVGAFLLTVIAAIASYLGTAMGVGELKNKLVTRTDSNAEAVLGLEADVNQLRINDANCERRLSVIDNNISNLQNQGNEINKISEKQIALAVELGRLQADVKNVDNTLSNLKQDLRQDFKDLGDKIDRTENH
jgi:peptidoglycan hydrolase CwlO-like protein